MPAGAAGLDGRAAAAELNPKALDDALVLLAAAAAELDSQHAGPEQFGGAGPRGEGGLQLAEQGQRIEQAGHEELAAQLLAGGDLTAGLAEEDVQRMLGRSVAADEPVALLAGVGADAGHQVPGNFVAPGSGD